MDEDLDYNYDDNKRCYFTNGLKREDAVRDKDDIFLNNYFDLEIDRFCWVYIKYSTLLELKENPEKFPRNYSCEYTIIGDDIIFIWRKYHIDTHISLMGFVDNDNPKYGGNKVVIRPLMLL